MKKFTWLLVAALWLAASPVWAVLVTQQAQVEAFAELGAPGANPPLDDITMLSLTDGRVFTNSTHIGADGLAQDLRTVGMLQLRTVARQDGSSFDFVRSPDDRRIIAVFGVQGRVFEVDNAKFTEGWLGFYEHLGGAGTLVPDNPLTWNPDDTDNMRFLTEYVMKEQFLREGDDVPIAGVRPDGPAEPVLPGPFGDPVFLPPEENNVSGVSTAHGAQGVGTFVFIENPDKPNDPFIDTSYVDVDGDPHLPPPMPGLIPKPTGQVTPEGLPLFVEGLYLRTTQEIRVPQPALPDTDQLDVLNEIGLRAFGDLWATGTGLGPDTHFDNSVPGETGDFVATLWGSANPVAQYMVPEPSTVAAWGFGWLLIVGWGAARRRRQRRS